MVVKKFFIKNRFGEKLEARKEYRTEKEKHSVVILIHGFGMDLHESNRLFDLISKRLVSKGFAVFRFSFAGCGKSDGDFKEMTLSRQAAQLKDVLGFVRKQKKVGRIGLLAQSFGTATTAAGLPHEIDSLIFTGSDTNPSVNLRALFEKEGKYTPLGISWKVSRGRRIEIGPNLWRDLKKYNLVNNIKEITCPVLFIHGDKDDKTPLEGAYQYYKSAPEPKEIKVIKNCDHGFHLWGNRRKLLEKIVSWFQKTL